MSILSPADQASLIALGLASPVSEDGTRKIHKRRLNRSSDEENSHLPLSPISAASSDSESFSTIPDTLISLATLRYLGFNDETADNIWSGWDNWEPGPVLRESDEDRPNTLTMTFIHYLTGHLNLGRGNRDAWDDDDQTWYDCMNRCGINAETQAAIMDPIFTYIRRTESCYFWMRDTVDMRYRGLKEVQRASQERERALHRSMSRSGQSTSGGPSSTGAHRSISSTIRMAPGISQHTAMSEAATLAAQNAPGSITLYKGLDQARLDDVFDESGRVADLTGLLSSPPSDFLGREEGFCFTVHRDVAVYYASYAKRRAHVDSIVIIHITIPNAAIESLPATELQKVYWPSTEWKTLIFISRRGKKPRKEICKFQEALLTIGTIASQPNHTYHRLDDAEQITENMVLKTNEGNHGIQYVFHRNKGDDFLMEHGARNMKVHPLTSQEFRAWCRDHEEDD